MPSNNQETNRLEALCLSSAEPEEVISFLLNYT
jgi:hypothetical protein